MVPEATDEILRGGADLHRLRRRTTARGARRSARRRERRRRAAHTAPRGRTHPPARPADDGREPLRERGLVREVSERGGRGDERDSAKDRHDERPGWRSHRLAAPGGSGRAMAHTLAAQDLTPVEWAVGDPALPARNPSAAEGRIGYQPSRTSSKETPHDRFGERGLRPAVFHAGNCFGGPGSSASLPPRRPPRSRPRPRPSGNAKGSSRSPPPRRTRSRRSSTGSFRATRTGPVRPRPASLGTSIGRWTASSRRSAAPTPPGLPLWMPTRGATSEATSPT